MKTVILIVFVVTASCLKLKDGIDDENKKLNFQLFVGEIMKNADVTAVNECCEKYVKLNGLHKLQEFFNKMKHILQGKEAKAEPDASFSVGDRVSQLFHQDPTNSQLKECQDVIVPTRMKQDTPHLKTKLLEIIEDKIEAKEHDNVKLNDSLTVYHRFNKD